MGGLPTAMLRSPPPCPSPTRGEGTLVALTRVDVFAPLRASATSRAGSTLRISCVRVSRVTTSQARQPETCCHSSRCGPAGLSRR